ncbi:hypothetical protein Tco_1359298 [Tanacetum coccineum]
MNVQNEINHLQEMLNLRNSNQDPPVELYDLKGSDEGDNEIDSLTKEPSDTLLRGDKVISTTPARENDEFITSSVDDLVLIPRESDIPLNTPLSTTDVTEENFDINSPLGEYVVDFLMENVDVADLPRHLEFEDISSMDPPKSAPLNHEPLGNPDSVSRSLETSDLILEDLTAEIGLDDLIPTEIDDGYYDSEGDILFLEHLLIEETFFDPTTVVLPKKSTLLVTPAPASKQSSLREVERLDPFFSLTQSGGKTRVMKTPSFGFHHMPSPRHAAYSPKEVMYRFYHPHLTPGDGFNPEIKRFHMIVKTTVLVFNPPITQSLIIFMFISREILNPDIIQDLLRRVSSSKDVESSNTDVLDSSMLASSLYRKRSQSRENTVHKSESDSYYFLD